MIPFTATTTVLLPPEAFPEGPLRDRARKLPMWDTDRDMLIMRLQSQREYLGRLRRRLKADMDRGEDQVQGVHEPVTTAALLLRLNRQTAELGWEEALVVRNDLLLAAAQ